MLELSPAAIQLLDLAKAERARAGFPGVSTADLLLAFLQLPGSPWPVAFPTLQLDPTSARDEHEALVGVLDAKSDNAVFVPRLQMVLDDAADVARQLGQPAVTPEAILIALLQKPAGIATMLLARRGVKAEDVRQALVNLGVRDAVEPAQWPRLGEGQTGGMILLGEHLLGEGKLSQDQLGHALTRQRELAEQGQHVSLPQLLVDLHLLTRDEVNIALQTAPRR